ncbi:MAG: hypothetical protein WCO31_07825, partial [Actinomycetes bacterium]
MASSIKGEGPREKETRSDGALVAAIVVHPDDAAVARVGHEDLAGCIDYNTLGVTKTVTDTGCDQLLVPAVGVHLENAVVARDSRED